jgi:sarcosine oxidase gamma subunit
MLSFDYCHFEVSLSNEAATPAAANELRKTAQRLADEAVRQYQVAKSDASKRSQAQCTLPALKSEVEEIKKLSPDDWTSRQKGTVKALEDAEFAAAHKYQYDDDADFEDLPF